MPQTLKCPTELSDLLLNNNPMNKYYYCPYFTNKGLGNSVLCKST